MSAILSVAAPDVAYLLTDRAGYDNDGVIRSIHCKVAASKKYPAAITTRGNMRLGDYWKQHLIELIDRIGLLAFQANLPEILSDLRDDATVREAHADHFVEVVVAGRTDLGAFHLRFDTKAWEVEALQTVFYGGPLDRDPTEFIAGLEDGDTPESWVRRVGVGLMEACRYQRGRGISGDVEDWFAIGGGLDLNLIDKDGVRTETILEWPDKVGEKIMPQAAA